MDDEPVELHDDVDLDKEDASPDELLETETVDVIELLADEPSEDELVDDDDELEIAQLMDPYGINDY
jgi:hypothetical protein